VHERTSPLLAIDNGQEYTATRVRVRIRKVRAKIFGASTLVIQSNDVRRLSLDKLHLDIMWLEDASVRKSRLGNEFELRVANWDSEDHRSVYWV